MPWMDRWVLFLDEEAFLSIMERGVRGGFVNIFKSEYDRVVLSIGDGEDSPPCDDCVFADLGFKRMRASIDAPSFYEAMQTDEQWYALLPFRPPDVNKW